MNMSNNNGLIQPYIFFEGRCEEAIEFYKKALGAEVRLGDTRFAEATREGTQTSCAELVEVTLAS